jgi:hypothetical protein
MSDELPEPQELEAVVDDLKEIVARLDKEEGVAQ